MALYDIGSKVVEQPRKRGRYAKKSRIVKTLMTVLVLGGIFMISWTKYGEAATNKIVDTVAGPAISYVAPKAEAATIIPVGLSVEQLEAKLDAIVWGIESTGKVGKGVEMKEGETYTTFDPPLSWTDAQKMARCLKTGGKVNQECYSNGPRQIKIPTLQNYWPKLHDGETISEKNARDIAESNDGSRRFFLDCAEKIKGCADNWTSFTKHKTEGQIYLDLIREAKQITL